MSSAPPGAGPGPSGPTTPPPAGGDQRPPLVRPRDGRLIAGVAAGLADHLGMDVAIVRILIVVLTVVTSGVGLLAYVAAWILVPEVGADGRPAAASVDVSQRVRDRDPMFWVGVGVIVLGALLLINRPGGGLFPFWLRPSTGLLVPLVLIGFGVALWVATDQRRPSPPATPSTGGPAGQPPVWAPTSSSATPPAAAPTAPAAVDPTDLPTTRSEPTVNEPRAPGEDRDTVTLPFDERPASETQPITPPPGGGTPPVGAGDVPPPTTPPTDRGWGGGDNWSPPPAPARSGSLLTRVTLGLTLLTAGVLWLLDVADVIAISPASILAASLLVIGLGLLVGAVVGRGRGLIGVGLVLLPLVLLAELVSPMAFTAGDVRQAVGEQRIVVTSSDDLEGSYQLGAGQLTLDLRDVVVEGTEDLRVQVGFGEIVVIVPEDVDVEVTGQLAGGELVAFGRTSSGLGVDRTIRDEVDDPTGLLRIEVQVAFGQATVRRPFGS
jgi:phage shock protein PspC (stress-responsive transcriptional regulator)